MEKLIGGATAGTVAVAGLSSLRNKQASAINEGFLDGLKEAGVELNLIGYKEDPKVTPELKAIFRENLKAYAALKKRMPYPEPAKLHEPGKASLLQRVFGNAPKLTPAQVAENAALENARAAALKKYVTEFRSHLTKIGPLNKDDHARSLQLPTSDKFDPRRVAFVLGTQRDTSKYDTDQAYAAKPRVRNLTHADLPKIEALYRAGLAEIGAENEGQAKSDAGFLAYLKKMQKHPDAKLFRLEWD